MNNGWIKSYRSINQHELLANDNSAFIVFMKLLHQVDKTTGKYTTGRFKLAELTNLKPTTAWDALKRLEKHKMAVIKSDNKKTTVYICNWHKFQATNDNSAVNKPSTNRQQTVTKQEERKRIKKVNTKVLTVDKRNPEITNLISHFEKTVGIMQRKSFQIMAASELIKQHGFERSVGAINAVAASKDQQYAPVISNLEDLRDKWVKLEVFWQRKSKTSNLGVIV